MGDDASGARRGEAPTATPRPLPTTALATAIDLTGVLPVYLTGAMAVQLRAAVDLQVADLGYVFAAYFATAAVLSSAAGRWADRSAPARILRLGCVLSVAAPVGMASVAEVRALILFAALSGLATAFTRTGSSLLVAGSISARRQGLALGVRNCAIPGAALLAGLAVPLVALPLGWRWAFVVAACLSTAVLFWLPREIARPSRTSVTRQPDMRPQWLIGLAVAGALGSAAAVSLGAFTAVTAENSGMSEAATGMLIASGSLLGIASRVFVGLLTDRRSGSQLDVVVVMMVVAAAGYATMSTGTTAVLWLAVPVAYASGWAFYGSYYLSVIRLNPGAAGSAVGIAQSGAFTGSVIGPVVLGAVASRHGFDAVWITAATATLGAAAIFHLVDRGGAPSPSKVA